MDVVFIAVGALCESAVVVITGVFDDGGAIY